ncbi:M28 family peptidase [Isosphaeraceae bacterium EP7]
MGRFRPLDGMIQLLAVVAVAAMIGETSRAEAPRPELDRLRNHVEVLASPAFEGRRGAGARKAEAYVLDAFKKLGLEPLFGDSFTQDVPDNDPARIIGRNVGVVMRGSDPALRDEYVMLAAHYDHLGVRDGVLYPGADDNASAVAMLLETSRSFVEADVKPRRSVIFMAFDLEEFGLFGSRYFAAHPPMPLEQIRLFITADLIGRSLGGVCERDLFVIGAENSPGVRPWIEEASVGRDLRVGQLGADVLVLDRSDYGPFRSRKVPFLFFSCGESPDYHKPTDLAETLNYPKLAEVSRVMHDVVRKASLADSISGWVATPSNTLDEAVTVRDILTTLLKHETKLSVGAAQKYLMKATLRTLEDAIGRGTLTPEERARMVQVVRLVMFSVL